MPALRCTVGVAAPLLAALLLHQPSAGVFIAVGSVSTGFGAFQGAYRSRATAMVLCGAGMAASLFIGSLAGHSTLAACAVAALWGFGSGLFVALGSVASFVALQSTVAVIVAGAFPADPRGAAARAILVLAGALVQIVLVVGLWPLRRFRAEREAIGGVYRSLAAYADALPATALAAPEPHTLAAIESVQRHPQPFARSQELLVFRGLLDEAERIRASLAALSLTPARSHPSLPRALSSVLGDIAAALDEGRAPTVPPRDWKALDDAAADLRTSTARVDALLGQLRSACRMAQVPATGRHAAHASLPAARPIDPLLDALRTIRANLSLRSTAFRHAVRLAVALALGTVLYRSAGLPRGYWLPMTTLIVLKPEYKETFVVGTARSLGTLAGAGLAWLLVQLLGAHPAVVSSLLIAFVWGCYATFRVNYIVFTISMTGYVVMLLFLAGVPGPAAATYRALDTVLGGALALVIYRVWPTWESTTLGDVLGALAAALSRDADLLLGVYVDPGRWDPEALRQAAAAARLARSNAEASVARALAEPARDGFDPDRALGILAAFRRYALGGLALHAGLDVRPPPAPALAPLRDQIVASLDGLAAAMRAGTPPAPLPPLRQTLVALDGAVDTAIGEQVDVMIDGLNTVAALLSA